MAALRWLVLPLLCNTLLLLARPTTHNLISTRPQGRHQSRPLRSKPALSDNCDGEISLKVFPFVGRLRKCTLRLRGGGRKGRPKATPEERAAVDAIQLTPEQEKDLRRHWKRKPEYLKVMQGGIEKRVKTKSILNVFKDRALEMKKKLQALPFRLVDLGLMGLHWFRETPELLHDLAEEPPKVKSILSPDMLAAVREVEAVLGAEDGYAIAREVRPRLVEAAENPDTDRMQLEGGADTPALLGTQGGQQLVAGAGAGIVGSHQYGEVCVEGFAEALELAGLQAGERFIDLGAGTGKAVLAAAGLYALKSSRGVECVGALHAASTRLLHAFRPAMRALPLYKKTNTPLPEIELVAGDALAVSLADADVAFAACTCWDDADLQRLFANAKAMPRGARLLVMSRYLDVNKKEWKRVASKLCRYGRGKMTFHVYKKLT